MLQASKRNRVNAGLNNYFIFNKLIVLELFYFDSLFYYLYKVNSDKSILMHITFNGR